jgi:hypothetical protein
LDGFSLLNDCSGEFHCTAKRTLSAGAKKSCVSNSCRCNRPVCLRFFDAGLGATLQLELCVARVGKHD